MLEAVQERGRRAFRIAGEKNRRARYPMRRLRFQTADQIAQRHLEPARLLEQDARAAPPGQHDDDEQLANQQREPAAVENLQKIGARKVVSIAASGTIRAAATMGFHFHTFQITTNAISVVTTIVPVTAMP